MISILKRFYERSRKVLAFGLVGLILVAGVLPSPEAQLAAAVALLTIALNVLFEIANRLESASQRWFESFGDAVPTIRNTVSSRLERRRPVTIRWIGVTMEAGWPIMQNLLIDALRSHRSISIKLALMNPDSIADGAVQNRIRSTVRSVEEFVAQRDGELTRANCSIAVYPYDHRPTWHALLIDDDTLFYSPALPANFHLSSPQSGVEMITSPARPEETSRVEHIASWATEIFSTHPVASSSNA